MARNQMNNPEFDSYPQRLLAVVVVIIVMAVLFSGCADSKLFENRLMCTTDGSGAVVVSRWAGFGFASNLSDADVIAVCNRQAVKQ